MAHHRGRYQPRATTPKLLWSDLKIGLYSNPSFPLYDKGCAVKWGCNQGNQSWVSIDEEFMRWDMMMLGLPTTMSWEDTRSTFNLLK